MPEMILTEIVGTNKNVALITLNRPKVLNALCQQLLEELVQACHEFDVDSKIGAIIITGNERAFAAGADIAQMQSMDYSTVFMSDVVSNFMKLARTRKPLIAAVNGFALGGGCELAMICDIIYSGEDAQFGQPEVLIGTIPGAGGTQRLTHTIGKSKTMELCLTGQRISAQEARRLGLISEVFPVERVVPESIKLGEKIASQSPIIISMIKECVNKSFELTLSEGLHYERRMNQATFATNDQKEGMKAFLEKRKPKWSKL